MTPVMICDQCGAPVDLNEAVIVPPSWARPARYRHHPCTTPVTVTWGHNTTTAPAA